MDKLLLVDGSNLLFQMFFGMPARIVSQNGKPIQGVVGFIGALLRIIKITEPTHVLVVFDGEKDNERKELNSDYKSNRIDYSNVNDEDNPFSQISMIYDALEHLEIKHVETTEFEADDLISSYAMNFNSGYVIISSHDSDFFQIVSDKISVMRYRGKNTISCDIHYIKERFGVTPDKFLDFKALVGDKADNIKGIKGIGPKTAAKFINQFGSIENMLNCCTTDIRKMLKAVIDNDELVLQNKRLIGFVNVELPIEIVDLSYSLKQTNTKEVLRSINI